MINSSITFFGASSWEISFKKGRRHRRAPIGLAMCSISRDMGVVSTMIDYLNIIDLSGTTYSIL